MCNPLARSAGVFLLAKIGADTAENEQHFAEILPIGRRVAGDFSPSLHGLEARSVKPAVEIQTELLETFGKMLLVFGCIGSDFCK